jgi:hypothetical protein
VAGSEFKEIIDASHAGVVPCKANPYEGMSAICVGTGAASSSSLFWDNEFIACCYPLLMGKEAVPHVPDMRNGNGRDLRSMEEAVRLQYQPSYCHMITSCSSQSRAMYNDILIYCVYQEILECMGEKVAWECFPLIAEVSRCSSLQSEICALLTQIDDCLTDLFNVSSF